MSDEWQIVQRPGDNGGIETLHTNGTHFLVVHPPKSHSDITHGVAIGSSNDGEPYGSLHRDRISFGYPSGRRAGGVFIKETNKAGVHDKPPSPELLSLIESHHENLAWMPLLDKLVEEYPEHFSDAVASHTAARNSSAAEQYARAFAASQLTGGVG